MLGRADMNEEKRLFTEEAEKEIRKILKRRRIVELRNENGNVVAIEISRKVVSKTPL